MKNKPVRYAVPGLILIGALLFTGCQLSLITDPYQTLADGGALPASFAIASGNPVLMQECLVHNYELLNTPGLSAYEKGRIALDMIDLLAVLSQVLEALIPYMIDNADPSAISDIEDFYQSASVDFLAKISEYELITYALNADPAPLQYLWGTLGIGAYLFLNNGGPVDWTDVDYSDLSILPGTLDTDYSTWTSGTDTAAASSPRPGYLALITRFKEVDGP